MKRALSLLTALLALAYAAAALADYRNDYLNGRDAAKKGDWEKARTLMQSALRERADPVARARLYGTIPEPYVPHYYLGLANARLGDCRAAVDAFENDASKAVIAGLKELAPVQARELASCRQSLLAQQPDAPPAVAQGKPPAVQPTRTPAGTVPLSTQRIGPAQALLDGLDRSIRGIESKLAKAPLAGSGDARAASRQLATFKQQRDQARANLQDAGRAGDAALLGRVEASARSVESGLAQLDAQVDAAARGLNEAIAARLLEARRNSIGGVLAKLDARSR
ncbi:MAG: hypothetical protein DYH17_07250, partial [Xanthomonadales bacterium PRO6]|nr:hypothetical protein [Xanthomonadales bacterium PRO6]